MREISNQERRARLGPTVHCSSTISMIEAQQKRVANILESSGITNNGTSWVASVSGRTMKALESRGEATAAELTKDVPELGEKITAYKKDGTVIGTFGVSTRILFLLAVEGWIIRATPKGSWVSSLYSWTPMERWTGQTLDGIDRRLRNCCDTTLPQSARQGTGGLLTILSPDIWRPIPPPIRPTDIVLATSPL